MNSMTGYGKGIAEGYDRKLTIELKAVNHRYLDLLFKLPRGYNFLEDSIRKEMQKALSRGHVDIYCSYEDNREGKNEIKIDTITAKKFQDIGIQLENMGFLNDITASQVLKMPEVLVLQGAEEDEAVIKELAIIATKEALSKLIDMRKEEGAALAKDIIAKLDGIVILVNDIKSKAPQVSEDYREKLRQRMTEILSDVEVDEARLLNEVAYFADKANIDEELTRLKSHVEQGRKILTLTEPSGRKLDFLVQEMNREVNTIGSKSNDLYITQKVLELKGEIEKIREQVQNIE